MTTLTKGMGMAAGPDIASEKDEGALDRDDLLGAANDPACLGRLIDRHSRRVFRYLYSRIQHVHTCEDLAQDIFLRLTGSGYDGTTSAKTWIFTIARHRVIDFFRTKARQPITLPFPEDVDFPQANAPRPERRLSRHDDEVRLVRLLSQLPEEQAEAVRLRVLVGLSFAQTADVLQCSIPTCKSRVRYGLEKLKVLFQEEI